MVKNNAISNISFEGGRFCLDFVNSVHNRKSEIQEDYLFNILDLIYWAGKAGVLTEERAIALESTAMEQPKDSQVFFESAVSFRELAYRLFLNICKKKEVEVTDLTRFNEILRAYYPSLGIDAVPGGFEKKWDLPERDMRWIMAPIVMDTCELLLSDKLARIKECPNCGWLFQDTTKNGKRKWCSMQACGSSVKALEWYHRNKNK